jgi:hypothetical protein
MVTTLEEDFLVNGYERLEAAGVDSENARKEMKKFLEQIETDNNDSAPSTPETVDEAEFEVVISSDEEENEEDNDSDDFVVNEDIE